MPVKCSLSLDLIVEKHELFCFFARFNESSSFDLKPTKSYGEKHLFRFRLCIFFSNEKGFFLFYNLHRFKVTQASKTVAINIFDFVSVKEPA